MWPDRLLLLDAGQLGLEEAAARLQAGSTRPLFADLGGQLDAAPQSGDGLYAVERLYRLQAEGPGCEDASFKRLIVHASGNEPGWSVRVSGGGMVLERPNASPLALPYLEESLPDGSLSFSSAELSRSSPAARASIRFILTIPGPRKTR